MAQLPDLDARYLRGENFSSNSLESTLKDVVAVQYLPVYLRFLGSILSLLAVRTIMCAAVIF